MTTLFQPLDHALGTRSKVRILRVLLAREDGLSGREVARQADVSSRTALQALEDLGDLGLVHREISPAEHRFSVNRRHVLVTQGLEGLFATERRAVDEVFDRLKAECSRLTQETAARIRAAWLFGSAMRGEDRPASDLDLVVVTEGDGGTSELRAELADVREELAQEFGLDLSPVVLSVDRIREMDAKRASLARAVREDARRIFGSSVHEVLGGPA